MSFTRSVGRATPRARYLLSTALLVAAGQAARADADTDPFHWGYSAMFGRGTYVLGDDTEIDVYRAAFKFGLREPPDEPGGRVGLRLLLPVAVGLNK
jgi:hypothetical protein